MKKFLLLEKLFLLKYKGLLMFRSIYSQTQNKMSALLLPVELLILISENYINKDYIKFRLARGLKKYFNPDNITIDFFLNNLQYDVFVNLCPIREIINYYNISSSTLSETKLSDRFMIEFYDLLDWEFITSKKQISIELINKIKHNFNFKIWTNIYYYQFLTDEFIEENLFKIEVHKDFKTLFINIICERQILSEYIMGRYKFILNWDIMSRCRKFSLSFMRLHKNRINWYLASGHQNLTENFVRELKDYIDFNPLSYNLKMSESFMEEFEDKLNWIYLLEHQIMSSNFMRKHKNKLNWMIAFHTQLMSKDLIEEMYSTELMPVVNRFQAILKNKRILF